MPFLNLSPALGPSNAVLYNVSYMIADQPPGMTTQTVFITFSLVGLVLLLLSVSTKSEMCNDLSGLLALPFLLISSIQAFAVDVSSGNTFIGGTSAPYLGAIVQTHTIYHYDLIGVTLGLIFVLACVNLYRLWVNPDRITKQEEMNYDPNEDGLNANNMGNKNRMRRGSGKGNVEEE